MYSYTLVSKPNRAAVNELLQQMSKFRKSGMYIINRALYSYSLNQVHSDCEYNLIKLMHPPMHDLFKNRINQTAPFLKHQTSL